MFRPKAFLRHPHRYPSYRNVSNPLRQPLPAKCSDGCKCDDETCPCVVNNTTCEASCSCSSCQRRYPPCSCDNGCQSNCACRLLGRDCIDGHCKCAACWNKYATCRIPPTEVKFSNICGKGLFAKYDILPGTLIGEYYGPLVNNEQLSAAPHVIRFAYSKGLSRCTSSGKWTYPSKIIQSKRAPNVRWPTSTTHLKVWPMLTSHIARQHEGESSACSRRRPS